MRAFRRRVLIDIDPGFTQFWHAAGLAGANVEGHDAYFTIGELIGTPTCPIPTNGIDWQPVRQPVILEDWPVVPSPEPDRFTTIATWRGPFGRIEHGGRTYGLKVHEFRKFVTLPHESPHRFEVALDIHPGDSADLEKLRGHGWKVVDPRAVAGDPDAYRAYVQGSGGEFSVAQGVYVDTACGWFSDRSTRYLASGRPVLLQDTGFSRILPVGEGLVAFTTSRRPSRAPPTWSRATRSTPPPPAFSPRSTSRRPSCSPPSASEPESTASWLSVVRRMGSGRIPSGALGGTR